MLYILSLPVGNILQVQLQVVKVFFARGEECVGALLHQLSDHCTDNTHPSKDVQKITALDK